MSTEQLLDHFVSWLRSSLNLNKLQEDSLTNRFVIESMLENQGQTLKRLSAIEQQLDRFENLLSTYATQQEHIMSAKFSELLTAIESTGIAIIEKVNSETAEVVAALEKAKEGATKEGATPDEIQSAIDKINALKSTVGDAINGIIPTVESPTLPTPPTQEVPVPQPEAAPVPDLAVPVTISPSLGGVGVDGGSSIAIDPAV